MILILSYQYSKAVDISTTLQYSYALSFYGSKIILDRPNCFGRVQNVLVESKALWSDPNHFEQVKTFKRYGFASIPAKITPLCPL